MILEPSNQIIGLIRFSFPSKNAFRNKFTSDKAQLDTLYAPERMAFRFELLEKLCFHSMSRQTDQNFKLIFLVGADMPREYLERLENIVGHMSGAVILPYKKDFLYRTTRKAFLSVVDKKYDHVTTFRLDDDDAVAIDYIEKTRAKINALIKADLASKPTVLAFTTGLYWQANIQKSVAFKQFSERAPLGLACAMVTTTDMPSNPYHHNHRQFGAVMPTLLDPSEIMYIRSIHRHNDSGDKHYLDDVQPIGPEITKILKSRFDLDFDKLD